MSEMHDDTADLEPRRARRERADVQGEHRRRRKAGTLNRMVQFKLQVFDPEDLDLENFVYYWLNDEGNNIRRMTQLDDYDLVTLEELGQAFNPESTDSESDHRVRMLVGSKPDGSPLYAYLAKKRRAFWEADYEEAIRAREDMMAGRVFHAEATDSDESRPGGSELFYASQGNQIGSAAQRRRGPVPRKL
jgi:hypothetical protein